MAETQILFSIIITIGSVYGAYGFVSDKSFAQRLTLLFWTTLLIQVFGVFCSIGNFSEHVLFTVYSIVALFLYLSIYKSITHTGWYNTSILYSYLSIPSLLVYVFLAWPITTFPEELVSVVMIVLTAISVLYYIVMLRNPNSIKLVFNEHFWFNSANIFYWPLTFVHISLIDLIVGKPQFYWVPMFHNYVNLVYYSILVFCLYLSRRNQHEPASS